jgi:hypothetical protein
MLYATVQKTLSLIAVLMSKVWWFISPNCTKNIRAAVTASFDKQDMNYGKVVSRHVIRHLRTKMIIPDSLRRGGFCQKEMLKTPAK